jgi:hypothetical protein
MVTARAWLADWQMAHQGNPRTSLSAGIPKPSHWSNPRRSRASGVLALATQEPHICSARGIWVISQFDSSSTGAGGARHAGAPYPRARQQQEVNIWFSLQFDGSKSWLQTAAARALLVLSAQELCGLSCGQQLPVSLALIAGGTGM